MKKFISVLMCAMMVLSMCTIVNAADGELTVVAKVGGKEVTSVVIDEVVEFTVSVKNVANADSAYIELGFTEDFEMVEGSAKWTSVVSSGAAMLEDYSSSTKDGTATHNAAIDMNGEIYSFKLKAKTPDATAKDVSVFVVLSEVNAGQLLNKEKVTPITITNKKFPGEANVKLEGATEVTYDGSAHEFSLKNIPAVAGVTSKVTYLAQNAATPTEEAPVDAGTYTVTGTVEADDYATITRTATLVIKPKKVDVKGLAVETKTYDATDVATIIGTATVDVINEDDVTVVNVPAEGKFDNANAGANKAVTYTEELALDGADKNNYELTNKKPALKGTIEKLAVTVAMDQLGSSKLEGNSDPDFNNYINLIYTSSALNDTTIKNDLAFNVTRAAGERVGSYRFILNYNQNANYNVKNELGQFTISDKYPQTGYVFAKTAYDVAYGDSDIDLAATFTPDVNTGKTPDSYKTSDATVVTVDETTGLVTIVGVGQAKVTAHIPGNDTYAEVNAEITFNVVKKEVAVTSGDIDNSANAAVPTIVVGGETLEIDMSASEIEIGADTAGTTVVTLKKIVFKNPEHNKKYNASAGAGGVMVNFNTTDIFEVKVDNPTPTFGTCSVNGTQDATDPTIYRFVTGMIAEIEVAPARNYKFLSISFSPDVTGVNINGTKITFMVDKDVTATVAFKKNATQGPVHIGGQVGGGLGGATVGSKVQSNKIVLTIDEKVATVYGEKVENDVAPIIVNDRTMLPIRFIAEALGARVEWDDATRCVSIMKDMKLIDIYIGSATAYINHEEFELDSPAFIQNDRTYLPIRFVAENLGADVQWNDFTRQVVITKK